MTLDVKETVNGRPVNETTVFLRSGPAITPPEQPGDERENGEKNGCEKRSRRRNRSARKKCQQRITVRDAVDQLQVQRHLVAILRLVARQVVSDFYGGDGLRPYYLIETGYGIEKARLEAIEEVQQMALQAAEHARAKTRKILKLALETLPQEELVKVFSGDAGDEAELEKWDEDSEAINKDLLKTGLFNRGNQ